MDELKKLLDGCVNEESMKLDYLKQSIVLTDKEAIEIDEALAGILVSMLKVEADEYILKLLANIAKEEKNRKLFVKQDIFDLLVKTVESDISEVTLQSLRCICNIAAENAEAPQLFSSANGVKTLLAKAEYIYDKDADDAWNEILLPACSCIQNIISDNSSLQEEFLKARSLELLWKFVDKFYQSKEEMAVTCINGIASLLENSELGLEILCSSGLLKNLLALLKDSPESVKVALLTELFIEYGKQETTRTLLCNNGCVEILFEAIESSNDFNELEYKEKSLKELADLMTLLTSGEESFGALIQKNKDMLQRFSSWIQCKNKYIQTTAGLALGNYARSEETCRDLVTNGIHENMINLIKEHVNVEEYYDRLQAFTSCLRNLCIPDMNKRILYKAGLADIAMELVVNTNLAIQFKALAILRLLAHGNDDLASRICSNAEMLSKLMELSQTSSITQVPFESQRLLATVAKYCTRPNDLRSWLDHKCLEAISPLLSSEHLIMKNEGLISIIMLIANVTDSLPNLQATDCMDKILLLLGNVEEQAQTLFNCITLVQALSSLEGGKDYLLGKDINQLLEKQKEHAEEIIRTKAIETLELLN